MLYSLYDFYSKAPLDLYKVREHYLRHFYQDGSDVDDVLRDVTNSSKVARLLDASLAKGIIPTYKDYLATIHSMLKFMLKSKDTQALAVIDSAILWDINVNAKANLLSSEELMQDAIKVFHELQIYKEIPKEEIDSMEGNDNSRKSWSLTSFARKFKEMRVREFVNGDTGEKFKTCVFYNDSNEKTFVSFSSKLGELTPKEIESMKEELRVVKSSKGKYSLYKVHDNKGKKVNI